MNQKNNIDRYIQNAKKAMESLPPACVTGDTHKHPVSNFDKSGYTDIPYNIDLWTNPKGKTIQEWINATPFPTYVFPPGIREFVEKTSAQLEMSNDFLGSAVLGVTGTVAGNSISLVLQAGYEVYSNLFISLVNKSGKGKSPICEKALQPLRDNKLTISFVYFMTHVTCRAILKVMQDNTLAKYGNSSLMFWKDELKGLLTILNSGNNEERQNFLSLFDGLPVNIYRPSSSFQARIPKPVLSLLGGIVTDDLCHFRNGIGEDGLMPRFLFAISREIHTNLEFPEAPAHCADHWEAVLQKIDKLDIPVIPNVIESRKATLTPEAREIFLKIKRMFRLLMDDPAIARNDSINSILSKADSRIGRLALVLQLLWDAEECLSNGTELKDKAIVVSQQTMRYAIELMFYFHVNSMFVLDKINLTQTQALAINLFHYCKQNSVLSLNKSDLCGNHYRKLTGCRDASSAMKIFETLQGLGLGEIHDSQTGRKGGRPATLFRFDFNKNP